MELKRIHVVPSIVASQQQKKQNQESFQPASGSEQANKLPDDSQIETGTLYKRNKESVLKPRSDISKSNLKLLIGLAIGIFAFGVGFIIYIWRRR